MSGNTFGQLFRITTFGESHGGAVGVVIDGCPPGLALSEQDIQKDLDRRKPGQSTITTPRKEADTIHIMSGIFEGKTTGTPIMLMAHNTDSKPEDYETLKRVFRPGHADFTFIKKFGIRDWRGSGRASARETLGRVAAGAVAKKFLKEKLNIDILSFTQQVETVKANVNLSDINLQSIESNIVRCPDKAAAKQMIALIDSVSDDGDSVGGIIQGIIRHVPAGLGEPVFDKLSADLGKAMLSINAVKGFDIGSGFDSITKRGSQNNDEFSRDTSGKIHTKTNHAGGILGGISSGEDIVFRVAVKPVSTINKTQHTVTTEGDAVEIEATGRHDPCILPRAVPIVDAMAALVIMDHWMRHKAQNL